MKKHFWDDPFTLVLAAAIVLTTRRRPSVSGETVPPLELGPVFVIDLGWLDGLEG